MIKTGPLFLFLFLTLFAKAQSFSIYQNITTSNGLPSNYVFASCEDENGFLWVGTDKGLCRYDGFRWQVWDKDNGLPGNYVNTVLPDRRGGLWLNISDKGYFHFSLADNKLQQLSFQAMPIVQSIQTDEEGNLYVEVPTTGVHTAFLFHPEALQKPQVVFKWTGNLPIVLRGDAKRKLVHCLSASGKALTEAQRQWKGEWPLRPSRIAKPCFEEKPVYYVSDSVLISSTDYFSFSSNGRIAKQHNLFPNGNSYAYACATNSGLYVYNIKTGYYFIDKNNNKTFYDKSSGLGTDYVNHIYQTSDGTIIISTLGAGLQLIKNRYRKTFLTDNQTVRTVIPDGNNWYLLAGNKIFKTSGQKELSLLGESGVSALHLFKNNDTLITGTLRGLYFFKEEKSSARQIGFLELTAGISSITRQGNRFLAGTFGSGLLHFIFNRKERSQTNYPLAIIEKLVPLSDGFAALSYEDGVVLTKKNGEHHEHLSQKNGLVSNSVYSIYQRHDTLWIGTKGGLSVFVHGKVIQNFRFPASLAQEKAIASFHDAAGKIWVASNRYLFTASANYLQPLSSFPLITEDDVVTTATYNAATNEVGIGSNKTFSIISLQAIQPNTQVAEPRLTKTVFNGNVEKSRLLKVPYDFGTLQFTIAPLSALPFSQSRFYFKLEGLQDEWKEVKDSLTISFSGLRPGSYKLLSKSINRDGYESTSIQLASFTVQKPFWLRWPFIMVCVLLIIATTAAIVRRAEAAKRRKKEAAFLLDQTVQAERQRIAKDLHDHLGTNLATMIAQTDNIEARLQRGDLRLASETVQHLSAQSRETMNVLRETIWAVQETEHSLNDFLIRIRTFLQRFFESTDIQWEVINKGGEKKVLSPAQTMHLFRIIQEASQNILKHAAATKAQYSFFLKENVLQLVIEDNGRGIIQKKYATNGLVNIQERVKELKGTITITELPSVTITVSFPL